MRLYLGNLPYQFDERTLERELVNRGIIVMNVKVVRDKETQMPRGFGFAEVDDSTADTALGLSGAIIGGRAIKIDRANEQERRPRGGGGGGSGRRREERFEDDWQDDRRRRR